MKNGYTIEEAKERLDRFVDLQSEILRRDLRATWKKQVVCSRKMHVEGKIQTAGTR